MELRRSLVEYQFDQLFVRVDELTCRVSKGIPNACNLLYAGYSKCCKGVRLCNSYVTTAV
jgi:hypothetical protein